MKKQTTMNHELNDREVEEIRWECLMRSQKFINCWEELRVKLNNLKIRDIRFKDNLIKNAFDVNEVAKQLIEKYGNTLNVAVRYYAYLHNTTADNQCFDKVWEVCFKGNKQLKSTEPINLESLNIQLPPLFPPPVADFGKSAFFYIDKITETFREINGREPNIEELKHYLHQWFNEVYSSLQTILVITQLEGTAKETDLILKQIADILKKKEKPKDQRLRLPEYKKYLRAYDLSKKGKTWRDIAKDPIYKDYSKSNLKSYISKDLKKARELIEKAENGALL